MSIKFLIKNLLLRFRTLYCSDLIGSFLENWNELSYPSIVDVILQQKKCGVRILPLTIVELLSIFRTPAAIQK